MDTGPDFASPSVFFVLCGKYLVSKMQRQKNSWQMGNFSPKKQEKNVDRTNVFVL